MRPSNQQHSPTIDHLSRDDVGFLLAGAKAYGTMRETGNPLQHRHVAVLCDAPASASADLVADAAATLGAMMVRLHASQLNLGDGEASSRNTARMLGRLYSLIACDGLAAPATAALSRWAGVPVLDGVGDALHPARLLAGLVAMHEHAGPRPAGITLGVVGEPGTLGRGLEAAG